MPTNRYRARRAFLSPTAAANLHESSSGQSNPKWEMWKKRFPGRGSELIDLLLVHEQMNTKQLSVALKCDPRTLAQLIFKMKPVISKNGGLYSLQNI